MYVLEEQRERVRVQERHCWKVGVIVLLLGRAKCIIPNPVVVMCRRRLSAGDLWSIFFALEKAFSEDPKFLEREECGKEYCQTYFYSFIELVPLSFGIRFKESN